MKNNKKKRLKGMTLVEIIVSLAVLSIMTLILVRMSTVIEMYVRSANNVNAKVVDQAPIAEAGFTQSENVYEYSEDVIIRAVIRGGASYDGATGELTGKAYKVGEETDGDLGGDINIQFIEIETPTNVMEWG